MYRSPIAVLAAAVGVAVATLATPASASIGGLTGPAADDRCAMGRICFFVGKWYDSSAVISSNPVDSGACHRLGRGSHQFDAWSVINNSGRTQRMWERPDCTGRNWLLSNLSAAPEANFAITSYGGE